MENDRPRTRPDRGDDIRRGMAHAKAPGVRVSQRLQVQRQRRYGRSVELQLRCAVATGRGSVEPGSLRIFLTLMCSRPTWSLGGHGDALARFLMWMQDGMEGHHALRQGHEYRHRRPDA